jgi:DNA-binding NarL/FixJ family response regulator
MSLPLNWMVLFLFISIAVVLLIAYEVYQKFKWKKLVFEHEDKIEVLKNQLAKSTSLKLQLNEITSEIKSLLSSRQYEVFVLTVEGLSSKEIAEKLHLSARTVDSHIKEIITKLELEKRSQMAGVFFDKLKVKSGVESITEL